MMHMKIGVKKLHTPDNAKSVCKDRRPLRVAKMAVDVLKLHGGVGGGGLRHQGIAAWLFQLLLWRFLRIWLLP